MVQSLTDSEFGTIEAYRHRAARRIKIGVTPKGVLRATLPPLVPLFQVRRMVDASRPAIRQLLAAALPQHFYTNGMRIGKSHTLFITDGRQLTTTRRQTAVTIAKPADWPADHPEVQRAARQAVIAVLRKEAKHYLPQRLAILAAKHGYTYQKVRFSHAGTRWGSCSSAGTISLNIALMKLPFELIDYVLIHELCHTRQMNHSQQFWALVAQADPSYKSHKQRLASHTPTI